LRADVRRFDVLGSKALRRALEKEDKGRMAVVMIAVPLSRQKSLPMLSSLMLGGRVGTVTSDRESMGAEAISVTQQIASEVN